MATQNRRKVVGGGAAPLVAVATSTSSLTPRSQSLPQLLAPLDPSISIGAGANAGGGGASAKCRGEFCRVAPSALPGLYGSTPQDNDDEQAVNASSPILVDNGERFKIGNNNLLLAKAEMAFLVGGHGLAGAGDDVTLQWQEADNVHRTELGRSNPSAYYKQVGVCRNCHHIYSDLARFRELGFRWQVGINNKSAWSTSSGDQYDGRERTKAGGQSKDAKDKEKKRTKAKDQVARRVTPEQEENDYDKQFLAELAKHSDEFKAGSSSNSESSARSERSEPTRDRRPVNVESSDALPALLNLSAKSKKPTSGAATNVKEHERSTCLLVNNQHAPSSRAVLTDDANVLHQLEVTVQRLRGELVREQNNSKTVEAQRQFLEQRLAQADALMQEKEDTFRKKLLEVELDAVGTKTKMKKNGGGSLKDPQSASSPATEMTQLIETIDSLNLQLDESNTEKDKMRRDLMISHHAETKRIHDKYQQEMEALRLSDYMAKEQSEAAHIQMTHWQTEAQFAMTQAKSARAALDELTKTKLPLLEEKNRRLERQLMELKAKASAVASSTASSVPSSATQDVAAMEKHLNNKMEYLKAQLASEMKCKEELGNHLAQITASMEVLKKEKRNALADQEEEHKRHVERMQANFVQENDLHCAQQASFQGKIATLQANVTDLVQELTLCKSKDANSKLTIEKMAEENVRLTRQLVDLESLVETLQEERQRDTKNGGLMSAKNASEETQRMQMEALLRRLDNERQYLKNQVDNEAELKNQSQLHAQTLATELQELKFSTEEMTKIAEHTISNLQTEKLAVDRQFRDEKAALEESKLLVTKQLKDLQIKFMQMREQCLVDKDELDKGRIELQEARSQLISAREEATKEKDYGKVASDRMSKALGTIKNSLKVMEEEKNRQIQRLDEENTMYMQKLAKAQGDLLVMENKATEDKHAMRRQQALARFLWVLDQRLRTRHVASQANAFWQLRYVSLAETQRTQLLAAHQVEICELENSLRREFMDKCDEMTQELHAERIDALSQVNEIHTREKDELQQFYQQEKSQLEEELRHLHARQIDELEVQYEHTIKSVDEQSAAALSALQRRCEELQDERDSARGAFVEARTRCEEMAAAMEAKESALLTDFENRENLWGQETAALVESHADQLLKMKDEAEARETQLRLSHAITLQNERHALEKRYEEEATRWQEELVGKAAEQERILLMKHADELKMQDAQHRNELEQEKQQLIESWQRELDHQRSVHEKTLKEALERVEQKTHSHLEALQKDMNDRKSNALLQTTAKWQKAMEELQARFEIEKKAVYDTGVHDREREWQQAATQIKQKQKEELENVQKEAVRAIKAAEERHAMLLQAQLTQLRNEFEEKHKADLERLQQEILQSEKIKNGNELEAALERQASFLQDRFNQQLQSMRDELTEDHKADTEQLKNTLTNEKEALKVDHDRDRKALQSQLEMQFAQNLESLRSEKQSELVASLANQHERLMEEFDGSRVEMENEFHETLAAKLKEQEERLLNEQEDAISQVQEDSERLIEQVEVAMTELKKQKENLENELLRLRSALEEAEDAHFDVDAKAKRQHKAMVFHLLSLIMHAKKALDDAQKRHSQELMDLQGKCDHVDNTLQQEKSHRERELVEIRASWGQVQARYHEMQQTLTNYKRDELVAHRSAGSVLSNEIAIVTKQMDEVVEMKSALEKEIEQLQGEAHTVEASLRQLMLQSSSSSSSSSFSSGVSGGDGLNMAVVAKKRRLNEEFETLLEQIEKKKTEIRNIDKTLSSLRQRREEKENELKKMERKLVEILVGQQKQMLTLLNAAREVALPLAIDIGIATAS